MKFRSPTDTPVYLGLTSGHTIIIGPELIEVPQMFQRLAIAEGCVPEGMNEAAPPPDRAQKTKLDLIVDAMRAMVAEGLEGDFTTDGKPNTQRLSARAGFTVSGDERNEAWQALADD